MKKENKGITLIALVITIIVLLILVGVTVNITLNGGLIEKTKEAKTKQETDQIKEKLTGQQLEYFLISGKEISDETMTKIAQKSIDTNIPSEKFTVYYNNNHIKENEKNGNKELEEEYVLYRYDKTTAEERSVLQGEGIKALIGDVDFNGIINESDIALINEEIGGAVFFTENQQILGDINRDGIIDVSDLSGINQIINGDVSYEGTDF